MLNEEELKINWVVDEEDKCYINGYIGDMAIFQIEVDNYSNENSTTYYLSGIINSNTILGEKEYKSLKSAKRGAERCLVQFLKSILNEYFNSTNSVEYTE
jgi:hypothetical protein